MLEQLPEGKDTWKPHDKSMQLEYLAHLVAVMPTWIGMQLHRDELDVAPEDGSSIQYQKKATAAEYVRALDEAAEEARKALAAASDEQLAQTWKLKARGQVVQEDTRANMIQDTISHWSHHRGQLTVYLRLLDRTVPSTFGPSADDRRFA